MLHIMKALKANPKKHAEVVLRELKTPWGASMDAAHVLEEHPTPQFARSGFTMLNGEWRCTFVAGTHRPCDDLTRVVEHAKAPTHFDGRIIVPFSPEAPLSGVGRQLQPDELLWYRRRFTAPAHGSGQRILLHFQAVDHTCAVWVNGHLAGTHAGGYLSFTFDISELLVDGQNELTVCVADPSEFGDHVRGKQRFDRGDIWYTAQSGIWQSVWMETVPALYLRTARIEPDAQSGILAVGVAVSDARYDGPIAIDVRDDRGDLVASAEGACRWGTGAVALRMPDLHRWSPDDPYLYRLELRCGQDVVHSYCGFRTVEVKRDGHGMMRIHLNDEPLFVQGVLDQAYWPDGLMTAPADEALVHDIESMQAVGFNLMRKHIKVDAQRWYYHCDRLGMLVMQDMVSGGAREIRDWQWKIKPTMSRFSWRHFRDTVPRNWRKLGADDAAFREEWIKGCCGTVKQLYNHPSVIAWSLFNEGWGQFSADAACTMVRTLDSSRLLDATSGWYDQGCGDFSSVHNYFRDLAVWPDRRGRAFLISEFGGYTHRVDGHSALDEAYGYELHENRASWRAAVRALLAEARGLEAQGLAGFVYTQVSDIEEEMNGILTYDRRVNKLLDEA